MPDAVTAATPMHRGHTPGYLDGAPAADAFQGLIDRGLFNDSPPAVASLAQPAVASPEAASASAPVETPKAEPEPLAASSAEPEEFTSLDDYLTKSQLDRAAFLSLPVKAKVDGKELDVPLAKLLESYQISEHLSHKSNAFAEERRGFETQKAQAIQQMQQQLQQAQIGLQFVAQQALGAAPAREQFADQGEWAAKQLDYQQRAYALAQHLSAVQQAQQQISQSTVESERQRMLDAIPEWRDQTKFTEASQQLSSYAASRGFSPAELSQVIDHRYMLVLHEAARARDLQAQVDTLKAQLEGKTQATLKLVRAAPPMASPGARVTTNPNRARVQEAKTAMRSGKLRSLDSQAAAFQALVDAGAGAI